MRSMKLFNRIPLHTLLIYFLSVIPAAPQDWPMWGGSPDRNMVSSVKKLPSSWDVESGKNIKWKAGLGVNSDFTHNSIG